MSFSVITAILIPQSTGQQFVYFTLNISHWYDHTSHKNSEIKSNWIAFILDV